MSKTVAKKRQFIPDGEQDAAAKYFALSNLGMASYLQRFGNNIDLAYNKANEDLLDDVGVGADDELKDWKKSIKDGDPYCYVQWLKIKPTLKF